MEPLFSAYNDPWTKKNNFFTEEEISRDEYTKTNWPQIFTSEILPEFTSIQQHMLLGFHKFTRGHFIIEKRMKIKITHLYNLSPLAVTCLWIQSGTSFSSCSICSSMLTTEKKVLSQKFVEKGRKNMKESHRWKDQLHWLYCSHQYRSCSWWSCEQAPPWWLIDSLQTEICDGLWEQGQTNKMICAHLQTYILDCLFGAWQCKSCSAHPINMNTCKNYC